MMPAAATRPGRSQPSRTPIESVKALSDHPEDGADATGKWEPGVAPVAVVMITLNEAHNLEPVLENLRGWAQEVHIVDSYSKDSTIDIALRYGARVVQHPFRGFGDQWNFAMESLPVAAPWTMKLDPDERLDDDLKRSVVEAIEAGSCDGMSVERQLYFMGRPLPAVSRLVRVWRTGSCRFTDVRVNEHPIVTGTIVDVAGILEHHDSPDLSHWLEKQNRYSTMEAASAYEGRRLAASPRLFGTSFERRMWMKKNFSRLPFRFSLLFLYNFLVRGTWRAGRVGYIWALLRSDVMRLREYKLYEFELLGGVPEARPSGAGLPDPRVEQH